MIDMLFQIWDAAAPVLLPVLTTVGAATGISIFTPNSSQNKILNLILDILNRLSGNVLNNKNA